MRFEPSTEKQVHIDYRDRQTAVIGNLASMTCSACGWCWRNDLLRGALQ
jgi:hypothetical protein